RDDNTALRGAGSARRGERHDNSSDARARWCSGLVSRTYGGSVNLSRYFQKALFVLAAGNLAVLVWDLITGGIYFKVFGHVISSWDIRRPAGAAAVCGALALWLRDRSAAIPTWLLIPRWSRRIA